MRRFFALSLAAALTGCAARPETPEVQVPPTPAPQAGEPSGLTGLTAPELIGRFGAPALQIREGSSLKLQFRGARCIMDAYLYPSAGSPTLKVTHVDARDLAGGDFDQSACAFSLRQRS